MEYQTATRQKILNYLEENPDKIFKASEISSKLKGISPSTVYRNLVRLEKQGAVQIVGAGTNSELRYRYMGANSCEHKMHLVCKSCGDFFHLDDLSLKLLELSVERLNGFSLDSKQSMLLGSCAKCKESSSKSDAFDEEMDVPKPKSRKASTSSKHVKCNHSHSLHGPHILPHHKSHIR